MSYDLAQNKRSGITEMCGRRGPSVFSGRTPETTVYRRNKLDNDSAIELATFAARRE